MYQAAWKRFYTAKPLPTEGNGWLRGTNLVLMTSTGRLLSGSIKDRNGLARGLQEVLLLRFRPGVREVVVRGERLRRHSVSLQPATLSSKKRTG